jgi:hypothetical protein
MICNNDLDLLASGVWEDSHDVADLVLMEVDMWIERSLLPLERVYVCPLCGYVVHRPRGVILWPRCPLHNRRMKWYIPKLFKDSKLKEWLKENLASKLMMLGVLARRYAGRPPDVWRLYAPPAVELAFDGDPTVFRYAWWRNMFEVYLHRVDEQFLPHLKKIVDYFGLELCVEVPRHAAAAPPDAVYDEEGGVYRIVVKPL